MIEYERKFLIDQEKYKAANISILNITKIKQGYISADNTSVVRLRCVEETKCEGALTWLITIKQSMLDVGKNHEFEYEISDASELFESIERKIDKTRYFIPIENSNQLFIELDEFHGKHDGIVIAEVELQSEEDSEWLTANLPDWFTQEVTGDNRYSNYHLCNNQ